ncbi:MAG: VOC family protein [Verrucomicrobiales bacterium]|nr:VOC family protein [Verrucomicrobiales bacterium]
MSERLALVSVVVRDYDEALAWYVGKLGFTRVEDTPLGNGKRWVVVSPGAESGASILLARAATPEQELRIGNQTGGRVFLFLHTDDFPGFLGRLQAAGVRFDGPPRIEPFGRVAVFYDLYGNKWDLVERASRFVKPGADAG